MSHLMISRLLKPCALKNVLRHKNARLFSSTPTYPFLLIDYLVNNPRSLNLGSVYDESNCSKQKEILFYDEPKLRDEVIDAMTSRLPYRIYLDDDNSLSIVIKDHNQRIMRAYLPPLPSGSKVENIAMSCLPNKQGKDWVVGVKLAGSRLSFCRPFNDSKWINLKAMPESINPFSSLMFSKKDKKFFIPSTGGNHLCSFDLHFKEEDDPGFIDLVIQEDSKSSEDLGLYSRKCLCSRTNHLVELPTGQLLLVQWYGEDSTWTKNYNGTRTLMHKTKHFMVFIEKSWCEDYKKIVYTKDIGDFCIFLGYSEAFCVPANSSPGLKPNCIYFMGYSFGVYDLTTQTCTNFLEQENSEDDDVFDVPYPLRKLKFPYWPPPVPSSLLAC